MRGANRGTRRSQGFVRVAESSGYCLAASARDKIIILGVSQRELGRQQA